MGVVLLPPLHPSLHARALQYTYSGLRLEPERWHPSIAALKRDVEAAAGAAFNSCLLNFYRRWAHACLPTALALVGSSVQMRP